MQQMHHQPSGDGLDPSDLITTVQARVKRITCAARWLDRSAEEMIGLRLELAEARDDNAGLLQEVLYWRRDAAERAELGVDEMPPQHYVTAVRTPQHEPCREVTVDIDDLPWTFGLARDRPTDLDPLRVLQSWHQLVTSVREARAFLAGEA